MVSLSSNERASRISSFKDRISALRATTKTYSVCDKGLDSKSVGTLDSSLASSSCFSGASPGAGSVASSIDQREGPPVQSRANPFDDSSEEGSAESSCAASKVHGADSPSVATAESSVDGALFSDLMGNKDGRPAASTASSCDSEEEDGFHDQDASVYDADASKNKSFSTAKSEYDADDSKGAIFGKLSVYDADESLPKSTSMMNPFDDDSSEESNLVQQKPVKRSTSKSTASNPYGVTPNPFDDSSIDESFIGTVSSTLDDDVTSGRINSNHSVVSAKSSASGIKSEASVDGELFSNFRSFLHKPDTGAIRKLEGDADRNMIMDRSKMMDKKLDADHSSRKSVGSCASSSFGGFSIESLQESSASVGDKDIQKDEQIKSEARNLIARLGSRNAEKDQAMDMIQTVAAPFESVAKKNSSHNDDSISSSVKASVAPAKPMARKSTPFDTDGSVGTADSSSAVQAIPAEQASSAFDFGSSVVSSITSPKPAEKDVAPSCIASSNPAEKLSNPFVDDSTEEFDADESLPETEVTSPDFSASVFDSNGMTSSPVAFPEIVEDEGSNQCLPSDSIEENEAADTSKYAVPPTKLDSSRSFDSSCMDSSKAFDMSLERRLSNPLVAKVTPSPKKWASSNSIDSSSMDSSFDSAFVAVAPDSVLKSSIHKADPSIIVSAKVDNSDTVSVDSSSVISPESLKKNPKSPNPIKKMSSSPKKQWKIGVDSFDSGSMTSPLEPTPLQKEVKSTNPFADILAMRAKERKENNWIAQQMMGRNSNISQLDLESSSQEDNISEATPDAKQGKVVIENTDTVKNNPFGESVVSGSELDDASCEDDDSSDDTNSSDSVSMQGTIFTDLRKVLSNIPSVSYETNEEESDEECSEPNADDKMTTEEPTTVPLKQSDRNLSNPDFDVSQSEAFKDDEEESADRNAPPKHISAESCAVSSLKTTEFKGAQIPGFDANESFDCAEDVASVPRCPTSFEISDEFELPEMTNKVKTPKTIKTEGTKAKNTKPSKRAKNASQDTSEEQLQKNKVLSSDSATVESSIHRVIKLSPPKKPVVLRDGSISTKDSIVGKTIRVTNADMVAERIYLESLRAQVHAELKVHVADEEIRLALEGRLHAIRDFYKRKTTVSQLKPGNESDIAKEVASFTSHPKCTGNTGRPKILRDGSVGPKSPPLALTDVSSISCPKAIAEKTILTQQIKLPSSTEDPSTESLPLGATMDSSIENTQRQAYKRAESNIQEALKAANLSINQSEWSKDNEVQDEDDYMNKLSSRVTIPTNIYSHETSSWDDEDLMIHNTRSKSEVDVAIPSVKDAWSFYRQLNNLMSDNRVYSYEFQNIQKDPLYPYLNSLTGIADSGDDGASAADKKVKQRMREEFSNKSPHRICHILAKEAKEIQPELIEVCEDIARKLNMRTMAVGKCIKNIIRKLSWPCFLII